MLLRLLVSSGSGAGTALKEDLRPPGAVTEAVASAAGFTPVSAPPRPMYTSYAEALRGSEGIPVTSVYLF